MIRAPHHEFQNPTHPDAIMLWPVLLPMYQRLMNARFDLEAHFPKQSRLCHRMADAIREQMVDAELGLLNAHPEKRVQHALKARAA